MAAFVAKQMIGNKMSAVKGTFSGFFSIQMKMIFKKSAKSQQEDICDN